MTDPRMPPGRWAWPRRLHTIAVMLFAAEGAMHVLSAANVLIPFWVLVVPPVLVVVLACLVGFPADLAQRLKAQGGNDLIWRGWTGRLLVIWLVITVIITHSGSGPYGHAALVDGHPALVTKGGGFIRPLSDADYRSALLGNRRVFSVLFMLLMWVLTRMMELSISFAADRARPGAAPAP
jgi:hypothetical protein